MRKFGVRRSTSAEALLARSFARCRTAQAYAFAPLANKSLCYGHDFPRSGKSPRGPGFGFLVNRLDPSAEEFDHRIPCALRGERDVFESALERIVVQRLGVINAERGVDGRRDVFVGDGAVLRPARGQHRAAVSRGRADDAPADHSTAREDRELIEVMITPQGLVQPFDIPGSDRSSELAHRDDQRFVEQRRATLNAWLR